jgi:glucose uptake protein
MADVKFDARGALAPLESGKLTPYTAVVVFSFGVLLSNFVFNTAIMAWPFEGEPVALASYFQGTASDHFCGLVGGMIWCVGMTLSILAAGQAGFAISYGLGQGATMVAAFWGVFKWHEFRDAAPGTGLLLTLMFAAYLAGLVLVILARLTGTANREKEAEAPYAIEEATRGGGR